MGELDILLMAMGADTTVLLFPIATVGPTPANFSQHRWKAHDAIHLVRNCCNVYLGFGSPFFASSRFLEAIGAKAFSKAAGGKGEKRGGKREKVIKEGKLEELRGKGNR